MSGSQEGWSINRIEVWLKTRFMCWIHAIAKTNVNHWGAGRLDNAFAPAVIETVKPKMLVGGKPSKSFVKLLVGVECSC